jgi:hypothetical protein
MGTLRSRIGAAGNRFLDLVFGRRVNGPAATASSVRDAILNNKPLPVGTALPDFFPIATQLPVGTALPPTTPTPPTQSGGIPQGPIEGKIGRWTNPAIGAPLNAWWGASSTWILKFRCDPDEMGKTGQVFVQFLSLAMVRYDNVPLQDWQLLVGAPSKGKWLYQAVITSPTSWSHPYTILMPPSRKVTPEIERENA